ncbi:hypothetical protein F4678DRAFT_483911 [Xylaria arbuscula]|nr:hypothetical protein F4678DRAFT_483911 [Xylaria arbuscula]
MAFEAGFSRQGAFLGTRRALLNPPDMEATEADRDLAQPCNEVVLADFGPRFVEAAGSMTGLRSIKPTPVRLQCSRSMTSFPAEREPPRFEALAFARRFLRTATALQVLDITFTGPVGPIPSSRRLEDRGWDPYYDGVEPFRLDDHDSILDLAIAKKHQADWDSDDEDDDEFGERDHYQDYTNDTETWRWACEATETLLGHAYGAEETPAWSSLRSLSLTQVPIHTADLIVLIGRHADTLSQLSLGEYKLDGWDLRKIASISNLRLSSIQMFRDGIKPKCTETFLLRVWDDGEGGVLQDDASSECTLDDYPGDGERKKRLESYYLDDSTGEVVYYGDLEAKHNYASDADDDTSNAGSVDSQDARVATAPRWKFGRFFASPYAK